MSTQATFTQLIKENEALIAKVTFLYADGEEDRKDLYQEIVSNAWHSFPRFSGKAKFSTWLYRVALNVAITSLKKRKRILADSLPEDIDATNQSGNEKELLQLILMQLNDIEKSLVLLLVEGMEQKEIAEILGISSGNVRVKIHRIREKLLKYGIKEFIG